jgi:hypothetical protein
MSRRIENLYKVLELGRLPLPPKLPLELRTNMESHDEFACLRARLNANETEDARRAGPEEGTVPPPRRNQRIGNEG